MTMAKAAAYCTTEAPPQPIDFRSAQCPKSCCR